MDKRGFIKLAGLGAGIVFSNSLNFRGVEAAASSISIAGEDFYFVLLSDAHWGSTGRRSTRMQYRC
jgi:hypothetical protein